jgi:hypothetical protein
VGGDLVLVAGLFTTLAAGIGGALITARAAVNAGRDSRRSDAYFLVAEVAVRARQEGMVPGPVDQASSLMPPPLAEDDLWRTHALVEMHGSAAVRSLYSQLLSDRVRSRNARHHQADLHAMQPPFDSELASERRRSVDDSRAKREALTKTAQALLDQINRDLRTTPGWKTRSSADVKAVASLTAN